MSLLLKILALLSQIQNTQLAQAIEQCVLTNTSAASIWACVLGKIGGANIPAGSADHHIVEAAKALAAGL